MRTLEVKVDQTLHAFVGSMGGADGQTDRRCAPLSPLPHVGVRLFNYCSLGVVISLRQSLRGVQVSCWPVGQR